MCHQSRTLPPCTLATELHIVFFYNGMLPYSVPANYEIWRTWDISHSNYQCNMTIVEQVIVLRIKPQDLANLFGSSRPTRKRYCVAQCCLWEIGEDHSTWKPSIRKSGTRIKLFTYTLIPSTFPIFFGDLFCFCNFSGV